MGYVYCKQTESYPTNSAVDISEDKSKNDTVYGSKISEEYLDSNLMDGSSFI